MSSRGRGRFVLGACALVLLAVGGCSTDHDGCAALCQPMVSFHYAQPRAGKTFAVTFAPQGPTIECRLATTGEATCQPNVGGFHLEFGPDGLRSFSWPDPPDGELEVTVTIDNTLVSDKRFDYQRSVGGNACAGTCGQDPMFDLE
jgi:hypothetical protein